MASASTWGNPNALKHVLLIHGMTGSSHSWHRIAPEFTSRGYFVTAPDLLGHGNAGRSSDYTVAALADGLQPYFAVPGGNDGPYDIIIGHSLGGLVASALIPLLKSTRPVRVILVDPPLELTPELVADFKTTFSDRVRDTKPLEAFRLVYPSYTRNDAIVLWLGTELCDPTAVEAIFDQNSPWSFSHLLLTDPENVSVTVLAADPTKGPRVKEEDLKGYPHVTSKTVRGASHMIPLDDPQAVVEAALHGTTPQNWL